MIKFLDLHAQYLRIQDEIDAAMRDVIRNTAFVGGRHVASFEENFAAYQQAEHCVGVANGTDAIEVALEALDLATGSEVIVPANSFIASAEAVTRSGHRVVFADVDPETYNLDFVDVGRRITGRSTAIIAVHLYGRPCDMDALLALARRHDLRVIEDCAQAHGAEYKGRRVGAIGDVGTFSFYPGKNLGAYGDAGAIVTDDGDLARRCRMIANHGRIEKYKHQFEGRNSRLDGMQAAILDVKLRYLDSWIDHRYLVAQSYFNGLAECPDIHLPVVGEDIRHSFHLFVIRTRQRDALLSHLTQNHVQAGIHYPVALPKLKAYAYLGQEEGFKANAIAKEVLSLPIGEHLEVSDVTKVCEVVRAWAATDTRAAPLGTGNGTGR